MRRLILSFLLVLPLISCGNSSSKKADSADKSVTKSTAGGKTEVLTTAGFSTKVADLDNEEWEFLGDRPVLIDFHATWCGPCKALAPVLEELAAEYGDEIIIYKVDIDKEPELASAFDVESIPTLVFIAMDEIPQVAVGGMDKETLIEVIDEVMLKK